MKKKTCLHDHNGAALVYLISAILVMSILGTAMYQLTTTSTVGGVMANHLDRTYYLAEAGAAWAYPLVWDDIKPDGNFDDDDSIHDQTFTLDDASGRNGQFHIDVDDSGEDIILLTVTGTIDAAVSGPSQTRIVYSMTKTQGDGGDGNGNGGIGGATPFSNGLAVFGGSNITMRAETQIEGNVATNSASIDQGWEASINGDTTLNAGTNMQPIAFNCPDCTNNTSIGWRETLDFPTGTYNFNNLTTHNQSQINITGDVIINVAGVFTLGSESRINIANDASLTLIIDGSASFHSESQVDLNGGSTGNFVIFGTANASDITFISRLHISGAVYAPRSNITLNSEVKFTGGVIGDTITMIWKSQVKWDDGVANVNTAAGAGGGCSVGLPTQYFQDQ